VHLAIDTATLDVIGVEATTTEWADCDVFEGLLDQIEGTIEQVESMKLMIRVRFMPPRASAARLWSYHQERVLCLGKKGNQVIADIAAHGVKEWKNSSGYHQRSLAENGMYRLKQLFGNHLTARLFESQVTEVLMRIAAMNIMTSLGMPVSVRSGTAAP
jgi:hypothetical protein